MPGIKGSRAGKGEAEHKASKQGKKTKVKAGRTVRFGIFGLGQVDPLTC
jgi:hypothetical protein